MDRRHGKQRKTVVDGSGRLHGRIVTRSSRQRAVDERVGDRVGKNMHTPHQGGNSDSHTHTATPLRTLIPSPGIIF